MGSRFVCVDLLLPRRSPAELFAADCVNVCVQLGLNSLLFGLAAPNIAGAHAILGQSLGRGIGRQTPLVVIGIQDKV